MNLDTRIKKKIENYDAQGGLDKTAKVLYNLTGINHQQVKEHNARVALLAEAVAKKLKKDPLYSFFAGLLHDTGKITQPHDLFDGHDISQEEYEEVKKHALAGFVAMKDSHLAVAICAGCHHAMAHGGYGMKIKDFPKELHDVHLGTIFLFLETSLIIAVCDFVDAFTHRKTKIKDGSDDKAPDLKNMLCAKYPNAKLIIDIALKKNKELGFV